MSSTRERAIALMRAAGQSERGIRRDMSTRGKYRVNSIEKFAKTKPSQRYKVDLLGVDDGSAPMPKTKRVRKGPTVARASRGRGRKSRQPQGFRMPDGVILHGAAAESHARKERELLYAKHAAELNAFLGE